MADDAAAPWGKGGHPLLSIQGAWDKIAANVTPIGSTTAALSEAAGHVLAASVWAAEDYPAFDKAMMDGFAVRAADCAASGVELKVLGLVPAGDASSVRVGAGQAMRINTGAPVPSGADAVVKVEQTTPSSDNSSVLIHAAVCPGQHVAKQGSDLRMGDTVLTPPVRLGAAQIAAAAAAGAHSVEAYRPVGVATVVTGNELVPAGRPRKPGQIFESNGPMLTMLLRQFGAEPRSSTIARDTTTELKDRFTEALNQPLVLAVGGMSMGTLDLVPQVLAELGVQWAFHGVAVQPGKPLAYGRGPAGQHVFGLPGNPVSVFVCAWLFVRMVIRGLQGYLPMKPPQRWRATLAKPLNASRDPRPAFVPARVWHDEHHGMMTEPCRWGGSGDPFGLAEANALLFLPTPTEPSEAGRTLDIILTSDGA